MPNQNARTRLARVQDTVVDTAVWAHIVSNLAIIDSDMLPNTAHVLAYLRLYVSTNRSLKKLTCMQGRGTRLMRA